MIDLHTHTTFSDGTTSPEENVALAAAAGLTGVAITDHDTLAGLERGAAAASQQGLEFVPGIEFSCEVDGASVHVLGYWMDQSDVELLRECDRLRNERDRRARAIVGLLDDFGVRIDYADVLTQSGSAPVGRPHIAAVMVKQGIVEDLDAAFAQYLADDGPAYVAKHALHPVAGTKLLRDAGAAVVVAHPALTRIPVTLIDDMTAAGLAGIEADHSGHNDEDRLVWRQIAHDRGLIVTASSDFHGGRKEVKIGQRASDMSTIQLLRAHCVHARV